VLLYHRLVQIGFLCLPQTAFTLALVKLRNLAAARYSQQAYAPAACIKLRTRSVHSQTEKQTNASTQPANASHRLFVLLLLIAGATLMSRAMPVVITFCNIL
jgi:hypothetical protein